MEVMASRSDSVRKLLENELVVCEWCGVTYYSQGGWKNDHEPGSNHCQQLQLEAIKERLDILEGLK